MKKKKIIKINFVILIIVLIILRYTPVFGRYVISSIKDLYLNSQSFYFTSDLLDTNTPTYTFSNWGGLSTYTIDFTLNSYQNRLLKLDYDLDYEVTCSVDKTDLVYCTVGSKDGTSSQEGIIYAETNTENIVIYITPYEALQESETVVVTISATAVGKYQKTISAKVKVKVSNQESDYSITDSSGSNYAVLELINTATTDVNVTLEFDPTVVNLDLNDEIYINRKSSETELIDGSEFVNKVTFALKKESTINIKFYKVDKTQNYTYPYSNNSCIINITREDS